MSKYIGVTYFAKSGKWKMMFFNKMSGIRCNGFYDTERDAAIAYDKKCLNNGLEPKNILKLKK